MSGISGIKDLHKLAYNVCMYLLVLWLKYFLFVTALGWHVLQYNTCLLHLGFSFTLLYPSVFPSPPTNSLLRSTAAWKVINDCGFGCFSQVCVEESICKLQMSGVKARLSCTEKSYEYVNCKFVIEMIKGSLRGIAFHTTLTNKRMVVRGSVELSNKEEECSKRYIKLFFPTWLWCNTTGKQ